MSIIIACLVWEPIFVCLVWVGEVGAIYIFHEQLMSIGFVPH